MAEGSGAETAEAREPDDTAADDAKEPVSRVLWLVIIGVFGLAVTAVLTFGWGVAKTYDFGRVLFEEGADSDIALVKVLEIVDTFLLATVLAILSIGLFDLFIAELPAPSWLVISDLGDLKAKVSDVIVLLLAIKFLERTIVVKDPLDLVWYAIAIALVSATLIAFRSIHR